VVGDTDAAVKWMRTQTNHNGKIGVFGSCSGGRHAVIYACQRKDVDACADLWGGRVVMGKEELNDKTPMAPIDMTFARALAPLTRPEDLVWVHDYHLIPLAEELRAFALTDRFIVLLNGVQKTDFTNPDANRGKAEDGSRFIGLQTHTGRVLFRNLEIKKLP